MVVKTTDQLHDVTKRIMLAAGASDANAECVTEHIVQSNLAGVDTHGVCQLPGYVDRIGQGFILPTVQPEVLRESGNATLITGNWGFGHVAAQLATQTAIDKARSGGLALVSMVACNHIGRLGHYVEMTAAAGMIGMVWAGGFGRALARAAPYGGRAAVLDTNPMAVGFPTGKTPVMFDFATTNLSGVKVRNAQRRGEQLPPGSIIDKDGNPTTNPNDFGEGGCFLPFGGHKGYALMVACEMLGGIFAGAEDYVSLPKGTPIMRNQGITMICFGADLFQPLDQYVSKADVLTERIHDIPPAPGFDHVLVPGDPEARTRAARQRDGIPIEDDTWNDIVQAAASVGVQVA